MGYRRRGGIRWTTGEEEASDGLQEKRRHQMGYRRRGVIRWAIGEEEASDGSDSIVFTLLRYPQSVRVDTTGPWLLRQCFICPPLHPLKLLTHAAVGAGA